jgi:acetyl-CoA C-acetyltransferase
MAVKSSRYATIVGAFEHPARKLPGRSVASVHAEVALGALADAGLSLQDVDAYFCAGDAPGFGPISMAEYMNLSLKYMDSTETGGSAPLVHIGHAADAIAQGRCHVALITLAGLPRQRRLEPVKTDPLGAPAHVAFEEPFGASLIGLYALAANRHMYEYGTTSAELAEIKVAASTHAQYNKNALLPMPVTVEEVLDSPMVSDPLHRLDCCVVTDGGGAVVVVSPEVRRSLPRRGAKVLGYGSAPKHAGLGRADITHTGAVWSGPRAFEAAGLTPADVQYASIYDSFTITVLETLEDLGFCEKGRGGSFVRDGVLIAPHGRLPINTDGGGLCNNHPSNRGGITKVIEATRQLRGEAHEKVQVPDCEIALVHGSGGWMSTRMVSATLLLGRDDA